MLTDVVIKMLLGTHVDDTWYHVFFLLILLGLQFLSVLWKNQFKIDWIAPKTGLTAVVKDPALSLTCVCRIGGSKDFLLITGGRSR